MNSVTCSQRCVWCIYLKNHRSVKKIRFGDAGEGGTGVTVVEFK
jgi:hypothetical protein